MAVSRQIRRRDADHYVVLRLDGSELGSISRDEQVWKVKVFAPDNHGVKEVYETFEQCQEALIKAGLVTPDSRHWPPRR